LAPCVAEQIKDGVFFRPSCFTFLTLRCEKLMVKINSSATRAQDVAQQRRKLNAALESATGNRQAPTS
jgi:hypothetical protein